MTFIYGCVNAAGIKSNFRSKAVLDIGMRIPSEDGTSTTIVSMDIDKSISVYDDAFDFAIDRMMR